MCDLHGEEESEDGHYGVRVLGTKCLGPWFAHHTLKGKKERKKEERNERGKKEIVKEGVSEME